jgi:hypothetical protein
VCVVVCHCVCHLVCICVFLCLCMCACVHVSPLCVCVCLHVCVSVNSQALSHRFMLVSRTSFSRSNCRWSTRSRKFFRSTYLHTHTHTHTHTHKRKTS